MTCPNCTHPRATLPGGAETCTWSEAWRLHCEALHVCDMGHIVERRQYLLAIHNKRGEAAWLQLRDAVARAWEARHAQSAVAGNTGS